MNESYQGLWIFMSNIELSKEGVPFGQSLISYRNRHLYTT